MAKFLDISDRLKKLLGDEATTNILPENDDIIISNPMELAQYNPPTIENQFQSLMPKIQTPEAIPKQSNSFLSEEQRIALDNLTQQRLKEMQAKRLPQPEVDKPYFSQIANPDVPYSFLPKQDKEIIASDIDQQILENPALLQKWQELGSPGRAGQYIQEKYSGVLPGQLNEVPVPGGPFAKLQQTLNPERPVDLQQFNVTPEIQNEMTQAQESDIATKLVDNEVPLDIENPNSYELDIGDGTVASQDALRNAQQKASDVRTMADLGRSLDLIGAGISTAKPAGQELFKDLSKRADQFVEDYQSQLANEKFDPKSPTSKAFQRYAKRLGVDIKGDFSAADGERLFPYIFRSYESDLNRKARQQEVALRLKEMNDRFKLQAEAKRSLQEEKDNLKKEQKIAERFDKMGKLVASEVSSSRSAFGRMANNIRAAEAIERLVQGRRLKDLDNREIAEVARSLDGLLSQGQPTISGTQKLIPITARASLGKLTEWLTNQRISAGADSFLKQMMKTVTREKELANEQIKRTQKKLLSPYSDLMEKDPEKWEVIMRQHELPVNPFEDEKKTESVNKVDANSLFDKF